MITSTKCEFTGSFTVRDITEFDFQFVSDGGYLGIECEGGRVLIALTGGNLETLLRLLDLPADADATTDRLIGRVRDAYDLLLTGNPSAAADVLGLALRDVPEGDE